MTMLHRPLEFWWSYQQEFGDKAAMEAKNSGLFSMSTGMSISLSTYHSGVHTIPLTAWKYHHHHPQLKSHLHSFLRRGNYSPGKSTHLSKVARLDTNRI